MDRHESELPFPSEPARAASAAAFAPGRWAHLAGAVGVDAEEPVVLALSGGADSVYLLHVLAAARPRPRVLCAHVDHRLRGAESDADAAFCAELARAAGFESALLRVELEPVSGDLEQRARIARYRALASAASSFGASVIATGHHADDSLETLLLRWTRGAELGGFRGVPPRTVLAPARGAEALNPTDAWLRVVRPLHALRREEVRETLRSAGRAWRDDSSNASGAFSRNRVRHALLPALRAACSEDELVHLAEFARNVEELEDAFARETSTIAWGAPRFAAARRGPTELALGGSLSRAPIAALSEPLLRRTLHRLVAEGTGRRPSRATVDRVVAALRSGASGEHPLHGGWTLALRRDWLHLDPPRAVETPKPARGGAGRERQLVLPFDVERSPVPVASSVRLALPGAARLADGRVLVAELLEPAPGTGVPRGLECVELDATGLDGELAVRFPRPGDRFHPLGAPGSRPLTRFLRDAGIPRRDRGRVALVCAGDEVLWVAGVRPAEPRKVGPGTRRRLRLTLASA